MAAGAPQYGARKGQYSIGKVMVYSITGKISPAVQEVIPGNASVQVFTSAKDWTDKAGAGADFLADGRPLSKHKEAQAQRLRALPCCLPEASAWLQSKVLAMLGDGSVVKIWSGK